MDDLDLDALEALCRAKTPARMTLTTREGGYRAAISTDEAALMAARDALPALIARVRALEAVERAAAEYIAAGKAALAAVRECDEHWNDDDDKDCNEAPCGKAMAAECFAKDALAAALAAAKEGG